MFVINAFVGDFYIYNYFGLPHDEEIDLRSYKCFNCMQKEY